MIVSKRFALEIAALCVLMLMCFAGGRMTAPKSVHDTKIVTVEKQVATVATAATKQDAIVQTNAITKYVDRIVRMPSGETIETKTAIASAAQKNETVDEKKTADVKIETQTRTEYHDRLVTVRAPSPRFSIGVNASMGLNFKPTYGAEVGVRIVGPLWGTLGADIKSRAAVAGLELVF